ncbi:type VI secretion system protein TssL, short form [Pseudomonas sp. xss_4]|uniref:type VI secretion system protein TssL, short form n=1 Tax=Pseudomonas TaxID=286 RepID=UPI0018D5C7FF|nr:MULTISPECIES: type VI secretion system protein TssL, short form [Pseudomonas]MBH3346370.1 DotU family type IV/VI secretion system protein [Pseudomonas parafulva]MEC4021798.1 type VI secretion system protein TssL, short form [Pseudomonas fulva]
MNRATQKSAAATVDIDALLQDTYLLVVELRHGTEAHTSRELWSRCVADVEHVRATLQEGGLDRRSIELISHAQCALLDETVLARAEGRAHEDWAMETLQAKFFSSHQAGEALYEDMRTALREASVHPHVLTVFQRVLMLGFLGRYRDANHPERQQLLTAISVKVPPLVTSQSLVIPLDTGPRMPIWGWLRAPLVHIVMAAALLGGAWWGLDSALGEAVASLLPVQE